MGWVGLGRVGLPRDKNMEIKGVPQKSILGQYLWNVLYNNVLNLEVPEGTRLIAYSDNLAAAVVDRNESFPMANGNDVLRKSDRLIRTNNL